MKKETKHPSQIRSYHFLPRKYGKDILLDIGRIESLKNFVLDSTPHQISFYEVLFIENGKGSFTLDEHVTILRPGTVIFTSPGQVRRWNASQVSGYTLFFEKDFLGLFFTDELFLYRFQYFHQYSRPTGMRMPAKVFEGVLALVGQLSKEFRHLQADSNHLLRAILYQLLVILHRHYSVACQVQSGTYTHPDFLRFRLLLEKQFMVQHRVASYARMLQISTAHLNTICRKYSGLSAQQAIHHRLIYEIKKQLRCNLSVKEIAYALDFSDTSNFNRFFKKLTGATVQEYRRSFE
jgi:AraC family transcriptional activator of pobA